MHQQKTPQQNTAAAGVHQKIPTNAHILPVFEKKLLCTTVYFILYVKYLSKKKQKSCVILHISTHPPDHLPLTIVLCHF